MSSCIVADTESVSAYCWLFVLQDLSAFADRVLTLHEELDSSDVYSRDCAIKDAWHNIDNILRRLEVLETEAHDLKELQELLEANIVNFDLLKQ